MATTALGKEVGGSRAAADQNSGLRCRPARRHAVEFDCRILTAARDLFSTLGVAAVSMHQVAKAACVGQGTLYRRYANKGELCLDLLGEQGQTLQAETEAFLAHTAATASARTRLDSVLERLIAFEEANGQLLSAIVEVSCGGRRDLQYRNPLVQWLHCTISTLLEQAVAQQEIPALDIPFTADALLSALAVDLYLFQRQERGFSPQRILQGVRHIYIDGLTTPRPASTDAAGGVGRTRSALLSNVS
ncbi:MAG: TetR/AcrR family transcriptional regulator [Chloroflexota bacterium]